MKSGVINKMTVLIILFLGGLFPICMAQTNTSLQGEIQKSDGTPLHPGKVYLQWPELATAVDSTSTDANGGFRFEKFPLGKYSIGVNVPGVDNSVSDVINISALNPIKQNQHFKIEDGILVCVESNYTNIKDARANKENVFVLNLNNLQFDVAEQSLVIGEGTKKLIPKIGEFINLESLSITINLLTGFPSEIGNLQKLTELNANFNKLNTLPAEMGNLKSLRMLDLGKNDFHQFPEPIFRLAALEKLNFESNPISELPGGIGALKNLKELNLSNCTELTVLPSQLGELSNLEVLDLSKCSKLKSLPDEIVNLKNLKALDVTGTKVSTKEFQKAVPRCEVRR